MINKRNLLEMFCEDIRVGCFIVEMGRGERYNLFDSRLPNFVSTYVPKDTGVSQVSQHVFYLYSRCCYATPGTNFIVPKTHSSFFRGSESVTSCERSLTQNSSRKS